MTLATLTILLLTAPPQPGLAPATVVLPDGREVQILAHPADLQDGGLALRLSPKLKDGAFWSFGDTFERVLWYDCGGQLPPTFADGHLSCPPPTYPRLRPNITLPQDTAAHPNSNVPPVTPRGRPVQQPLHVFAPWLLPCLIALALCLAGALLLNRRARQLGLACAELPADAAPALTRRAWAALLLLTGLACALRFYALGFEPFEQNEFTYFMSGMGHDSPLGVILDVNGMAQTHPPLFHLLLRLIRPFGSDETTARIPAALAGVALIPVLFTVAWRVTRQHLPATAAAVALAVFSPAHIWYAQDVSPYTLTVLASAVVLLSADAVLRDPRRRAPYWGLIGGTLGLVYTHYYGVHLALAVYALLLFWAYRDRTPIMRLLFWRLLASGLVITAGVVPWIPAFVQAFLWSRGHSTAYQRMVGIYHPTAHHLWDLLDTLRLAAGYPKSMALLSLAGLGLGVTHLARLRHHRRVVLFLIPLVWFVPFELLNRATFLHGLYGGWYFGIRYVLFLFPALWLLAALFLAAPAPRWLRGLTWLLALASLALAGVQSVHTLRVRNKPDIASATAIVMQNVQDGDAVIVGPAAFYQHPFHYYAAPPQDRAKLRINDFMQTPTWHRQGWLGVLSELFEPYAQTLQSAHIRRIWVVDHTQHLFGRREFSDRPSQAITQAVEVDFDLVWERAFHDASVRLFQRVNEPQTATDHVHFGWSDGPWVRRFQPPWAYAAPGRRVRPGAEVRIPLGQGQTVHRLRLRAGTVPPGGHQAVDPRAPTTAVLGVRVLGRPPATLSLSTDFQWQEIPLPAPVQGELRVFFDLPAPPRDGRRAVEIVLDQLELR